MIKGILEVVGFVLAIFLIVNGVYGFSYDRIIIDIFSLGSGASAVISYIIGTFLLIRGAGKCIFVYLVNGTMNDD